MFEPGKKQDIEEACWKGYHKEGMKTMFGKRYPNCVKNKNESLETYVNKGECPGCGGAMVSEEQINEKQDACYHKVKSRYKVWPSAYASGALVQCRKKGAANWGNKNESITQEEYDQLDENLKQWFSDKWVRFGPDGKIRGDCARGDSSEGKPKCLPQSKAHALGKKGRASAAARKRREDPNPERSGKAINVNTKKKSNEGVAEGNDDHIWGPQGNFAGDRIVNLGSVTMKTVEVGDTVKYFGQKAKVVAMSKDRKHSRINILSDFGGTTRDVLTSDLKQLGQGVAEGFTDDINLVYAMHPQPEESERVALGILDMDENEFIAAWQKLPAEYQEEFNFDLPLWNTDELKNYKHITLKVMKFADYVKLVEDYIRSQEMSQSAVSALKKGVAESQLNELAPNPGGGDGGGRDDGDDGFELPLDFKGQNVLVWPKNKKYSMGDTATPFPRGERFTGKVYIMWHGPKIEAIFYLDPKDREDREAEYERVYGPQGRGWEDWLDHKWYDTTTPRYRFVTDWRLIPAKEPGGWPRIVDAWGQDMIDEVMNHAQNFINDIIHNDGDGRHFVEPKQSVTEGYLNEFAPGDGNGEGRWYTDDQMIDMVGPDWAPEDDAGHLNLAQILQDAQAWLDDQGYSVAVEDVQIDPDGGYRWKIYGEFYNPRFAKKDQGVAEGSDKTFTVVYYSKKTDRNVTKQIKASSESELWDRLRAKGIDVVSIEEQGVAEEKIQEIQRKSDDPVGYSTDNRIVKSSDLKGLKMIPGSNRLGYSFGPMVTAFTGATHGIHLYDIKNRRLVGYLALAKSAFPLPKSYRVANVNIDDDYRGQGLGQTLYGIAIKLLGLTIEADDTQTAASRRMWVALSQIPGVEINGYAKIWADEWDKRDTPNEIYDDSELRVIRALIKAGGEELGRSHSSVYVSFPVGSNADKSELQSIQKSLAIYSRLHPEDGGTDNGLYARWGGQVREQGVAESSNKKQEATRRIQKMLNDKFGANLDVDGVLGPLTLKSINKFMPNAKVGPAEDPNKTTAVQGKKVKNEDTDQNQLAEKWSQKYKSSINCSNPKGFSQRAHCDGKKKNEDVTETAEYNYSNINDDDWYEFNSEGNVVRQSGPRRYELPFGSNKTIKLPNGNIAAKGMTAKRLKLFKNLSESREYYNVMCTDAKSLRQDFNMSKDRHGWFLKEGSTSKQKLDVYRAFGSPKLKEYDLSAFSGGTQTKGEDNVISPVGSQTRAQYKK